MAGRLYGKCSQVAEAWAGCNWLQRLISRYRREWGGRGGGLYKYKYTVLCLKVVFLNSYIFRPNKLTSCKLMSEKSLSWRLKWKIWGSNKDLKMQSHVLLRCKSWPSLTTTHSGPPSDRLHWPGTILRGRLLVCNAIRSLCSLCIIAWLTRHDS